MVVLDRLVDVGQRLRLDALGGVDDQQRALAGGEAAAHLIGEVDMAGRVHQVEDVVLAVLGAVIEPHGLRLDRDPALLLDVHIVEHLARHLALGQAAGRLDQPVGQGRFAMVDMGDDGEIADLGKVGHGAGVSTGGAGREAGDLRLPDREGSGVGATERGRSPRRRFEAPQRHRAASALPTPIPSLEREGRGAERSPSLWCLALGVGFM